MLSFCMTVCRLQTAQTDDRTQFCIYFSIFYLPFISLGIICTEGKNNNNNNNNIQFLDDLGRRLTQVTDDNREKAFLYQRLSVMIQRYNAVAILGTFANTTPEDEF